LIVEEMIKRI